MLSRSVEARRIMRIVPGANISGRSIARGKKEKAFKGQAQQFEW